MPRRSSGCSWPEPSERLPGVRAAGDLGAQAIYAQWKSDPAKAPLVSFARPAAVRLLVAAMPGIAMLAFTAYLRREIGVWFAWARMQEAWGRTLSMRPMAQGWEWLTTEGLMAVTRAYRSTR